jgi:cysteine-rich repeat protein
MDKTIPSPVRPPTFDEKDQHGRVKVLSNRYKLLFLAFAGFGACASPQYNGGQSFICGSQTCNSEQVCTSTGCALPEQVAACNGQPLGSACAVNPGDPLIGLCDGAACRIPPPGCGNSTTEAPEDCDDGNRTGGDGCSAICEDEICGNNIVDVGEVCDAGFGGDSSCSADCKSDLTCANGIKDPLEQCDDGNRTSGDGCDATCGQEVCGNGRLDAGEQCDDGNVVDGDGCNSCQLVAPAGLHWNKLSLAVSPPKHDSDLYAGLVFDPVRKKTVLFGGGRQVNPNPGGNANDPAPDSGSTNETWEFDGATWSRRVTAHSPPPRQSPNMVYDPVRNKVVMFGGCYINWAFNDFEFRNGRYPWEEDATARNDTWEYDGVDWSQVVTPNAPSQRCAAGITFDTFRNKVILYGGRNSEPAEGTFTQWFSDTWEYDGINWTQRSLANEGSLAPRITFDRRSNRVVQAETDGFWELNNSAWVRVPLLGGPAYGLLYFDKTRNAVMAFSPDSKAELQRAADGTPLGWAAQPIAGIKPALLVNDQGESGDTSFDPDTGTLMLFDGTNTWVLAP